MTSATMLADMFGRWSFSEDGVGIVGAVAEVVSSGTIVGVFRVEVWSELKVALYAGIPGPYE